jgi:hypothetical protein
LTAPTRYSSSATARPSHQDRPHRSKAECPYNDDGIAEKVGEIHDFIVERTVALHDR